MSRYNKKVEEYLREQGFKSFVSRYNKKVEEYLREQGFKSFVELYHSGDYNDVIELYEGMFYNGWYGDVLAYIYDDGKYIVADALINDGTKLMFYKAKKDQKEASASNQLYRQEFNTLKELISFFEG